jgi:uncharacterized protein YraI
MISIVLRVGRIAVGILACTVLAACNMPSAGPPAGQAPGPESPADPAASTAAAETVGVASTWIPGTTETPVSVLTQTGSALLTVTDNVNCRSGPGVNFERLTVIPETTAVKILARAASGNWWLVDPSDAIESCWVSGELGTVAGSTADVVVATPAAGEGSGVPTRPGNFTYNYGCSGGSVTTVMTWTDAADNENGYRVYRYGALIAELPANSTQFVDTTTVAGGDGLTYAIEAFNAAGASGQRSFSFTC